MARNEAQGDQTDFIFQDFVFADACDNIRQECGYYLNPYFLMYLLQPEYYDLAIRHGIDLHSQPGMTGQGTGLRDGTPQGNQVLGVRDGNQGEGMRDSTPIAAQGDSMHAQTENHGSYPHTNVSNTFQYQEANACGSSTMYGPQFTASGQEAETKPKSINSIANEPFPQKNTITSALADGNSMNRQGQGQRMHREVEYQEINLNTRTTNCSSSEAIAGTRDANEPHMAASEAGRNNFLKEPMIGESDLKVLCHKPHK